MPKYLVKASYTADGVKGLMKEGGSARRDAATRLIQSAGGKVESFHFAFGSSDAYVLVDMPDNAPGPTWRPRRGLSGNAPIVPFIEIHAYTHAYMEAQARRPRIPMPPCL